MDNKNSKTRHRADNKKYSKQIHKLSSNVLPLVLCDVIISYLNKYHLTLVSDKFGDIGSYSWRGKYTKGTYYWKGSYDQFHSYITIPIINFSLTECGGRIISYKYDFPASRVDPIKHINKHFKSVLSCTDNKDKSINIIDYWIDDFIDCLRGSEVGKVKLPNQRSITTPGPKPYELEFMAHIWDPNYVTDIIYEYKRPLILSNMFNPIEFDLKETMINPHDIYNNIGSNSNICISYFYNRIEQQIEQHIYKVYVADFLLEMVDYKKYPRAKILINMDIDNILVVWDLECVVHELEDVYQYAIERLASENITMD